MRKRKVRNSAANALIDVSAEVLGVIATQAHQTRTDGRAPHICEPMTVVVKKKSHPQCEFERLCPMTRIEASLLTGISILVGCLLTSFPVCFASEQSSVASVFPKPSRTIEFDTTEGTYVTLDVSPDGRTIVFDLLGDLYSLPIEGGTARRITSGMALDW